MITYELALKLKEAGYEQFPDNIQGEYLDDSSGLGNEQVYIPTLSELIEACGLGFEVLYESGSEWWSGIYNWHDHEWVTIEKGSTPEEAVANLYLSVKESKV